MQRLLRVLDHPQAADIIQKIIYSRSAATARNLRSGDETKLDDVACSRCSTMISILSGTSDRPCQPMEWSHHTLQQIVKIGSLEEGCALLSSLSSTAMYNLLVLLERNIKILSGEELGQFIKNIEQLPFVHEDEWCRFLILSLKRHIHGTQSQYLVDFKDVASKIPPSSAQLDATVQETNASIHMDGEQVNKELPSGGAVVPESERVLVPSPEGLRLSSPQLFEKDSESLPEANKEVKNVSTDTSFTTKMVQVHHQWTLSKAANQEDFNNLCSLDSEKFLVCLKCFNETCLPDTSITAISDNVSMISSLPSELSYHNAVNFLQSVILPMVVNLKQTAPRALTLALCSINSKYPDAMVPGLIIPVFRWHLFGAVHGGLLVKLFQESEPEQLSNVWQRLAEIQVDSNGDPFYWNEDVVFVLLSLFQRGVKLEDEGSMGTLVTALQRNAPSLCKSSKFAKLVMEICKSPQYQGLVSKFYSELSDVVSTHKSILKSALAREVRKLSAPMEED